MSTALSLSTALLGFALALLPFAASARDDAPKVGDPAPEFSLMGSDGETYALSDFKGEKAVVLAWFPKAFTGGCTKECTAFAEQSDAFEGLDAAYFTASTDTAEDNTRFAKSVGAEYPILSDPTGDVAKSFGVMMPDRPLARRVTFYMDKQGIIRAIDSEINTEAAGTDAAAKLRELGIASRE